MPPKPLSLAALLALVVVPRAARADDSARHEEEGSRLVDKSPSLSFVLRGDTRLPAQKKRGFSGAHPTRSSTPVEPEELLDVGTTALQGSASTRELAKIARQGSYFRLFGAAMVGEGLRFNNPYRLSRQLGKTGESLSLTAPYSDLSAGISFGPPDGLQHGLSFGWSEALSGVPQTVITPSYLALYRGPQSFMFWGRVGTPILLSPDANIGGEVAISMAYFFTSGIGAAASIVGSGYYGAGTWQVRAAFYPVLSAQLGIVVDYEVLP